MYTNAAILKCLRSQTSCMQFDVTDISIDGSKLSLSNKYDIQIDIFCHVTPHSYSENIVKVIHFGRV